MTKTIVLDYGTNSNQPNILVISVSTRISPSLPLPPLLSLPTTQRTYNKLDRFPKSGTPSEIGSTMYRTKAVYVRFVHRAAASFEARRL